MFLAIYSAASTIKMQAILYATTANYIANYLHITSNHMFYVYF